LDQKLVNNRIIRDVVEEGEHIGFVLTGKLFGRCFYASSFHPTAKVFADFYGVTNGLNGEFEDVVD
jgi:hypothetical protein